MDDAPVSVYDDIMMLVLNEYLRYLFVWAREISFSIILDFIETSWESLVLRVDVHITSMFQCSPKEGIYIRGQKYLQTHALVL